ncbi:transposase [Embleya scabrispora]|uniref:transposase n=1 Tax=Embleya scabrispora TaxID=159449 RepID=UPI001FE0A5FD|nr:transposase [Embleya scabrispora]
MPYNGDEQQTAEWQARYAVRSGVEGTVNELAHGHGIGRCRYRGRPKAHVQHVPTRGSNRGSTRGRLGGRFETVRRPAPARRDGPWRRRSAITGRVIRGIGTHVLDEEVTHLPVARGSGSSNAARSPAWPSILGRSRPFGPAAAPPRWSCRRVRICSPSVR